MTGDAEPLLKRLFRAQVASCTCDTMPPYPPAHDPMCRYRLFCEAHEALRAQPTRAAVLEEAARELLAACANAGEGNWGGTAVDRAMVKMTRALKSAVPTPKE